MENLPKNAQHLLSWMNEKCCSCGLEQALHPSVEFCTSNGDVGWHMRALDAIEGSDVLLAIPLHIILSPFSAIESLKLSPTMISWCSAKQVWSILLNDSSKVHVTHHGLTILQLVRERQLDQASRFYHYIQSLPLRCGMHIMLARPLPAHIQSSKLAASVTQVEREIQWFYDNIVLPLWHIKSWPTPTLEEITWATAVYFSRAINLPDYAVNGSIAALNATVSKNNTNHISQSSRRQRPLGDASILTAQTSPSHRRRLLDDNSVHTQNPRCHRLLDDDTSSAVLGRQRRVRLLDGDTASTFRTPTYGSMFNMGQVPALIPGADMLNHRSGSLTKWSNSMHKNSATCSNADKRRISEQQQSKISNHSSCFDSCAIFLVAGAPITPQMEICLDYGSRNHHDWALFFGFIYLPNDNDYIEIPLQHLPSVFDESDCSLLLEEAYRKLQSRKTILHLVGQDLDANDEEKQPKTLSRISTTSRLSNHEVTAIKLIKKKWEESLEQFQESSMDQTLVDCSHSYTTRTACPSDILSQYISAANNILEKVLHLANEK